MKTNIHPIPYGKNDSAVSVNFIWDSNPVGSIHKGITAELINGSGDCIDRDSKEVVTAQYMQANDKELFLLELFGYEKLPEQSLS